MDSADKESAAVGEGITFTTDKESAAAGMVFPLTALDSQSRDAKNLQLTIKIFQWPKSLEHIEIN